MTELIIQNMKNILNVKKEETQEYNLIEFINNGNKNMELVGLSNNKQILNNK